MIYPGYVTGNIVAVFLLVIALTVRSEPGDELVVHGGIVNLRNGPSLENEITLQLESGDKLYEIQRKDVWVEVRTGPTDGLTGWIHSSLVEKSGVVHRLPETPDREKTLKLAFDKFKPAFDALNARIELETGNVPFPAIVYAGEGVVRVTAAQTWLASNRRTRERHLARIFELWNSEVKVGLPVAVEIVDDNDDRLMVMFR